MSYNIRQQNRFDLLVFFFEFLRMVLFYSFYNKTIDKVNLL